MGCYFLISILIITRSITRPFIIISLFVAFLCTGALLQLFVPINFGYDSYIPNLAWMAIVGMASRLYPMFLAGILFYLIRNKIPFNHYLAGVIAAGIVMFSLLRPEEWASPIVINAVMTFPLMYLVVYVGVSSTFRIPFFSRGDYSYGIYLYGWPIQQVALGLLRPPSLLVHFAIALPMVSLFAAFSWHTVEKPILSLRKNFAFMARERLASTNGISTSAGVVAVSDSSKVE